MSARPVAMKSAAIARALGFKIAKGAVTIPVGDPDAPSLRVGSGGLGFYKGSVVTDIGGVTELTSLGFGVIGHQGNGSYGTGPLNLTSRGSLVWGTTHERFGLGNPININSVHNGENAGGMMGISISQWNPHTGAVEPQILTYRSRGAALGETAALELGDVLAIWQACGDDGVNGASDYVIGGQIEFAVDGPISNKVIPGQFSIKTTNTSGATVTALTVDSNRTTTATGTIQSTAGLFRSIGTGGGAVRLENAAKLGVNNTLMGVLEFKGKSSTGISRTYASVSSMSRDTTNTKESGHLSFAAALGGALTPQFYIGGSMGGANVGTGNVVYGPGTLAVEHGIYLAPQAAPVQPSTSGAWVIFVDSADGNKLKAKASDGAVVTLGSMGRPKDDAIAKTTKQRAPWYRRRKT